MEDKSWQRNHGEGLREEESLRRNGWGGPLEPNQWRRRPGGGATFEKESCRRNPGGNWEPSVTMYKE